MSENGQKKTIEISSHTKKIIKQIIGGIHTTHLSLYTENKIAAI